MARQARQASPTGYYHIMMRGNNREKIFKKEVQKKHFIKLLKIIVMEEAINIAAYCLMDNHIHLVLKGELENISKALRRVNIKYAMSFNAINDRVGHVFQDRYKSEIISDDEYLLQVVRYIHNNPVKAKIVASQDSYRWSSFNEYIKKEYYIVNPDEGHFIMGYFSGKQHLFQEFHNEMDYIIYLDTKEEIQSRKLEISKFLIDDYCIEHGVKSISQLKENPEKWAGLVKVLLEKSQMSHRQIADLLAIGNNVIHKISSEMRS